MLVLAAKKGKMLFLSLELIYLVLCFDFIDIDSKMIILQPDFKLYSVILYSVSQYINAYSKELYFVL